MNAAAPVPSRANSDVFISYSRADTPFVRGLYQALADAGREAWVDWEGIPPSAEWLGEVYAAIEAADAFVLGLSPDSVLSKVCALELAHAATHKKRLIPNRCNRRVEPQRCAARHSADIHLGTASI